MAKPNKKKEQEKNPLKKSTASFNLVGEAKVSDFTFKLDEVSDGGWQYSRINLGVDCGNGNVVYCDMMGGFGTAAWQKKSKKENVVYSRNKDFGMYVIDWEDRFNPQILAEVSPYSFIKVGLEKDVKGKTFVREFVSEYDAIEYIAENLEDGMVVNIKGDLSYKIYNDTTQIQKSIKSIFLSKAEPKDYKARFQQAILIGEDAVGKFDKETKSFPISARVLDYTKMWNGKEVKATVPFFMEYELKVDEKKPEVTKKMIDRFFKVKKGITEMIVDGDIVEGQQLTSISADDIPEDIKALIEAGIYDEEDILKTMAAGGEKVRKFVIEKPSIKVLKSGEGDNVTKTPQVQLFPEKYEEEDLILDFMFEDETDNSEDDLPADEDDDDDDWLSELADDDDEDSPF